MRKIKGGIAAALFGFLGAIIFWTIGIPLPWMLGAMSASAIVAIAGKPWFMPRQARDFARPVIGVLAGSAFTPAITAQAGQWASMIVIVVLFSIASTLAGNFFFRRLAGFDRATAYFAATPAGLTEMSLLGDSLGGNVRTLFLVHAVRVITVVSLVPLILGIIKGGPIGTAPPGAHATMAPEDWLVLIFCGTAGYLVGKYSKIPSGVMIASMIASAILHVTGITQMQPPGWLVVIVQVIIGCVVGSRFAGIVWREAFRTLLIGFIWALLLLGAVILTALAIASISNVGFSGLLLALAPGGMAEMTLITYALGIDVAFVATCQILRNFSTILLAPIIFRWFSADTKNQEKK